MRMLPKIRKKLQHQYFESACISICVTCKVDQVQLGLDNWVQEHLLCFPIPNKKVQYSQMPKYVEFSYIKKTPPSARGGWYQAP